MYRRFGAIIGIAAVALALSACGTDEPAPESQDTPTEAESSAGGGIAEGDFRNAPVPDADPTDAWEKDLPGEPGSDASMGEQIEYELISAAAEYAHRYDADAKVDCPDLDGGEAKDVTCAMTYFGQQLDWDVSISGGSIVASYEYQSDQRVLSREYVENALRFEAKTEDVMCEIDEEFAVVDPEKPEKPVCHSLADGKQTAWELSLSGYGVANFYEQ